MIDAEGTAHGVLRKNHQCEAADCRGQDAPDPHPARRRAPRLNQYRGPQCRQPERGPRCHLRPGRVQPGQPVDSGRPSDPVQDRDDKHHRNCDSCPPHRRGLEGRSRAVCRHQQLLSPIRDPRRLTIADERLGPAQEYPRFGGATATFDRPWSRRRSRPRWSIRTARTKCEPSYSRPPSRSDHRKYTGRWSSRHIPD